MLSWSALCALLLRRTEWAVHYGCSDRPSLGPDPLRLSELSVVLVVHPAVWVSWCSCATRGEEVVGSHH